MTDHRQTNPSDPIENGGRDSRGRWTKGNPGGPGGGKHARRVMALRSAFLRAITDEDMERVVRAMVEEAVGGNVAAAKLLCERALGAVEALDLLVRLEELESAVGGAPRHKGGAPVTFRLPQDAAIQRG